jgi:tetratricopeptide (TPR) repeat protein
MRPPPSPEPARPGRPGTPSIAPGRSRVRRGHWLWALPVVVAVAVVAAIRFSPDPDHLYELARAEAREGRWTQAAVELERLERLRPPTPVDRLLRAQVAGGQDRLEEAIAELGQIPDGDPLGALARLSKGQLEIRVGRLRPAEADFRQALATVPNLVQAHRELAYIYNVQGRVAELDEQLEALDALGAMNVAYLLHWGKVRHANWDASKDLDALERFVAADPEDRRSRLALAEALRRLNRLDEAQEQLAWFPDADPDARVVRAMTLLDRGDPAGAEALVTEGPVDHLGLIRLRGRFALARSDGPAAVEFYRRALESDPVDRTTLFGLATALRLGGKTEEAEPVLAAVRRLDDLGDLIAKAPSDERLQDPDLPMFLGFACVEAGRPKEARAWLALALQRRPLDAKIQQALYRLNRDAGTGVSTTSRPESQHAVPASSSGRRTGKARGPGP